MKITIATRKSKLALWQSEFVANRLRALGHECELLELSTRGDEILDRSLAAIGGKNLFIKELEIAMQQGRAQIAVHSLKDVGASLADDFALAAVCARECEDDVLVCAKHINASSLKELPKGAVIGTTSLRRKLQLTLTRSDLKIINLRGNLQTRLAKLASGEYDAIVLAYAGLARLNLLENLRYFRLAQCEMISAAGQGAVAIEAINEPQLLAELAKLECPRTRILTSIERDFTRVLNGGCGAPIGINASVEEGALIVRAIVGSQDASASIKMQRRYELASQDAHELKKFAHVGESLAQTFLAAGASELISDCKKDF